MASAFSRITATEYNWGCMFTGTKADLIAAKLAEPRSFKFRAGDASGEYRLPLDQGERYKQAVYGPNPGPIPPSWSASVMEATGDYPKYSVCIKYSPDRDLAVRERAELALIALQAALKMVEDVAPKPLGVVVPQVIMQDAKSARAKGAAHA